MAEEQADDKGTVHDLKFSAEVVNLKDHWREHQPDDRHGGGGGPPGPPDDGEPLGPTPTWASDDQLALELADGLQGDWYYVVGRGTSGFHWFFWDGQRFRHDRLNSIINRARKVVRWVSGRLDVKSLARSVSNGRTIFSIEKLARADERLARDCDDFDASEQLINTPGGVVNLFTGQLYPHDRSHLMMEMAGAAPEGECPVWLRFLHELTGGDQAYQDYLQRLVGYSLTGSTEEEIFVFLHGPSNTGKSKFVETVRSLHGSYGCTAGMKTFVAAQHHDHETEIADFAGKRLVTAAETDEGARWDQQRLTHLTGRDQVSANFMRENKFKFYPKFLLMFHGNHRPRISASSDGGALRRRMHLLPFMHRPAKIDKHLIDKLKAELGGIMKWAVLGAVLWKKHGLMPPPIVAEATNDYFHAEDILGAWIEERCETDKSREGLTRDMYNDYKAWAKAANEYVLSERRFSQSLENLRFRQFNAVGTRRSTFSGIGLRGSNDELLV
jgi:putative DNA primase/helicase